MGIVYVTGGARSGKSSFAEALAEKGKERVYLATSKIYDEEMRERVKKHREQRGENWTTVEAHSCLDEVLEKYASGKDLILVDCLTNMVTNLMLDSGDSDWDKVSPKEVAEIEKFVMLEVERLIEFSRGFSGEVIVVSNELGMGIVPSYPLGRHFRDIAGRANQRMAMESDEAYLLVSGLPVKLK